MQHHYSCSELSASRAQCKPLSMLCITLHQDKKRLEGRMVWLKCPACRGLISDQAVASFAAHFSGLPDAAADMDADTTEQYAASPERSSSDHAATAAVATTTAGTADAENSDGHNKFDTGAIDMVISPTAAAAAGSSSSARRRKRTSTLSYEESASKVAAAGSTVIDVDADAEAAAGDASVRYDDEQLSQDAVGTAANASADVAAAGSRDAHRGTYGSTVSAYRQITCCTALCIRIVLTAAVYE
jgi:hypothetical protein